MYLVVRTPLEPQSIIPGLRAQLASINKDLPISQVQTMDQLIEDSVVQERFRTWLVSSFAGLALLSSHRHLCRGFLQRSATDPRNWRAYGFGSECIGRVENGARPRLETGCCRRCPWAHRRFGCDAHPAQHAFFHQQHGSPELWANVGRTPGNSLVGLLYPGAPRDGNRTDCGTAVRVTPSQRGWRIHPPASLLNPIERSATHNSAGER